MRVKNHPAAARIKRMMQSDEEVGKMHGSVPNLIGRAMDMFIEALARGAKAQADAGGAKIIQAAHM